MTNQDFVEYLRGFAAVLKLPPQRIDDTVRTRLLQALRHLVITEDDVTDLYDQGHPFGLTYVAQPPERYHLAKIIVEGPQSYDTDFLLRQIFAAKLSIWALRFLFRKQNHHAWWDESDSQAA